MKDLEIFQALIEEEKTQVIRLARGKQYRKGESLFAEGDPAETIYLVKGGKVLLYKISEDGKELSLDILQENDIFGENTILENTCHTMYAKALENVFVCTCTQKDFNSLLINPIVAFKVISYLSEKLNNYTQQAAVMAFQDNVLNELKHEGVIMIN
ncbi:transcriptional regulator, Crp/Fnr family [Dehalobacter sp. CF]|jgi:cAMP-binding proteins - catabolite gene activator and regulatory subunit of cAMP-dependent protein kinases|nr:transcriptional regulator, Crp/Fnr family [Dehalobacter sp. CF]